MLRWKNKAPAINPKPSKAPKPIVSGINKRMEAISSFTPTKIRPQGSMPRLEKIKTDSGAAVNLKYRVCSMINADKSLKTSIGYFI